MCYIFFCKQKTSYEMRINDWSSDVCSSDLCCFGGGFIVSYFGIKIHNLALIYLGYGVLGGIGLGIGYISPVSTLIKWFPDRPGMATGMAIMGFGGRALFASPLLVTMLSYLTTPTAQLERKAGRDRGDTTGEI